MKSMKMDPAEQAEYANGSIMAERPLYPWGLAITLDDEALKKLGITKLPEIDQVMEIRCIAQVVGLHSRKESDEENDSYVNLQITDMEIVDSGSESAAEKLYGAK